jgi:hypothetical protein
MDFFSKMEFVGNVKIIVWSVMIFRVALNAKMVCIFYLIVPVEIVMLKMGSLLFKINANYAILYAKSA